MRGQQQQRHEQQQKQEGPDARIQGNDDFNYQVTNFSENPKPEIELKLAILFCSKWFFSILIISMLFLLWLGFQGCLGWISNCWGQHRYVCWLIYVLDHMDVSENRGFSPKSSILIGFSMK